MRLTTYIGLILMLILSACIYEDGPKMSFRSKKNRAVNVWYIDKVIEDGVDRTDAYKSTFVNYRLELKKSEDYELSYRPLNFNPYTEKGSWKFSSDKQDIILTPSGTSQENRFKVLRLKNSEFWVSQVDNGKTIELQLRD